MPSLISQPMIVVGYAMFSLKIGNGICDDHHVLIFGQLIEQRFKLGIGSLLSRYNQQTLDFLKPVFDVLQTFFAKLSLAADSRELSGEFRKFKIFSLSRIEWLA